MYFFLVDDCGTCCLFRIELRVTWSQFAVKKGELWFKKWRQSSKHYYNKKRAKSPLGENHTFKMTILVQHWTNVGKTHKQSAGRTLGQMSDLDNKKTEWESNIWDHSLKISTVMKNEFLAPVIMWWLYSYLQVCWNKKGCILRKTFTNRMGMVNGDIQRCMLVLLLKPPMLPEFCGGILESTA